MPEPIVVRSPFDGSEVGRVEAHAAADVERAVIAGHRVMTNEAMPAWRRAAILDAAAAGIGERFDELARTIAVEAAKPLKTARVEVVAASAVAGRATALLGEGRRVGLLAPRRIPDLPDGLDASELIADAARTVKGGGGKSPDLAVAGGKDPGALDAALDQARAAAGGR